MTSWTADDGAPAGWSGPAGGGRAGGGGQAGGGGRAGGAGVAGLVPVTPPREVAAATTRSLGVLDELLTPDGLADPYAVYDRWRVDGSAGPRVLLDHASVTTVLADPTVSSDRVAGLLRPVPPSPERDAVEALLRDIVVFCDPPRHPRLRRLLLGAFTARVLRREAHVIDDAVRALLAALPGAVDGGVVDLHRVLSYPLPALVVGRLLGVPDPLLAAFTGWAVDLVFVVGSGGLTPALAARLAADAAANAALVSELVATRRAEPTDDLLSAMVAATTAPGRDGEAPLTDAEIAANALFLMTAGHETATNQLSNAVLGLLGAPDQAAALRDGTVDAATAAGELLRHDPAVQLTARRATVDGELAGRSVRAGDSLLLVLGAASNDPARFADPRRLDLARTPNPHLAFAAGPHRCLGAALATAELAATLPALLRAHPRLALAADRLPAGRVERQPTLDFRGPTALPVTL